MYGYVVYDINHDVVYDSGSIYASDIFADAMANTTAIEMDCTGYNVYLDDGTDKLIMEV